MTKTEAKAKAKKQNLGDKAMSIMQETLNNPNSDIPSPSAKPAEKNKGGRPKSENKQKHRISVYLTDDEYNTVKEYAEKQSLTISSAARKTLLQAAAEL